MRMLSAGPEAIGGLLRLARDDGGTGKLRSEARHSG